MSTTIPLACPPIPLVRIALIGLGARGMKTLERYAYIPGAQIVCLADLDARRVEAAQQTLRLTGRPAALGLTGPGAWREACRLPGADLVYICTEWSTHATMAIEAMNCGKHAAVEVPAATTLEECRRLVRTAETTRRHCFMAENCCYDLFALQTLEIHRQGLLGHITHLEGAYIHDLTPQTTDTTPHTPGTRHGWMERSCALHGGNPYPTHGIGPMAQLLSLHEPDPMERLVSLTARGIVDPADPNRPVRGRVNTSIIQTRRGTTLMLQLDVTTPRPYSRLQTVCGTHGYLQKYPLPTVCTPETPGILTGEAALSYMDRFSTSPAALLWKQGHSLRVPNEMNYAMDARLIHCLRHGHPLDISVYDAAEWSALAELTRRSAQQGGMPVQIPQFRS